MVGRGYAYTMRGVQVVKYISPDSIIGLGNDGHIWDQGPSVFADNMARSRYYIIGVSACRDRQTDDIDAPFRERGGRRSSVVVGVCPCGAYLNPGADVV